jgi:Fur family iron response transcriptional regulator
LDVSLAGRCRWPVNASARHSLGSTRQRLALVRLLFEQGDRHVTAEQLHGEAVEAAVRVSLATVYNTLHQFIEAGLLR